MKPKNWKELSEEEKRDAAMSLLYSKRGHYIVSQALVKAIDVMKAEPEVRREASNIEDMEMLLELFPIYKGIEAMEEAIRREDE